MVGIVEIEMPELEKTNEIFAKNTTSCPDGGCGAGVF